MAPKRLLGGSSASGAVWPMGPLFINTITTGTENDKTADLRGRWAAGGWECKTSVLFWNSQAARKDC